MTPNNHTPGPWKVIGNCVYQTYVAGGHEIVDENGIRGRECCNNKQDAIKEIKANARLIAAAPELLELAEKAIEELRETGYVKVSTAVELEEAIRKAKGGS